MVCLIKRVKDNGVKFSPTTPVSSEWILLSFVVVDYIPEWSFSEILLPVPRDSLGIFSGTLYSGPGRLLEGYDVPFVCPVYLLLIEKKAKAPSCVSALTVSAEWDLGFKVRPLKGGYEIPSGPSELFRCWQTHQNAIQAV